MGEAKAPKLPFVEPSELKRDALVAVALDARPLSLPPKLKVGAALVVAELPNAAPELPNAGGPLLPAPKLKPLLVGRGVPAALAGAKLKLFVVGVEPNPVVAGVEPKLVVVDVEPKPVDAFVEPKPVGAGVEPKAKGELVGGLFDELKAKGEAVDGAAGDATAPKVKLGAEVDAVTELPNRLVPFPSELGFVVEEPLKLNAVNELEGATPTGLLEAPLPNIDGAEVVTLDFDASLAPNRLCDTGCEATGVVKLKPVELGAAPDWFEALTGATLPKSDGACAACEVVWVGVPNANVVAAGLDVVAGAPKIDLGASPPATTGVDDEAAGAENSPPPKIDACGG